MTVTIPEDACASFVELLYLAVFRRPADVGGRDAAASALARGESPHSLLQRMLESPEFNANRLVDRGSSFGSDYDPAADRELDRWRRPELSARSDLLRSAAPVSRERFDAAAARAIDRMQAECPGMAHQDEYLRLHRERFYELANLTQVFVSEGGLASPKVLDVGFSTNTMLLQFLMEHAEISICDRFAGASPPPSLTGRYFQADLTATDLDDLDLGYRADVILFAEVIEHLMANPVRVLSFLTRHLTDRGRLVITTPNLFRREILDRIAVRNNPQFILPAAATLEDLPHFHVREYAMKELLGFAEQAGGKVEAFFYSPCWDSEQLRDALPPHEWGNMVVVVRRA